MDGLIKKRRHDDFEDVVRVDFGYIPCLVDGLIKKSSNGGC